MHYEQNMLNHVTLGVFLKQISIMNKSALFTVEATYLVVEVTSLALDSDLTHVQLCVVV